jgi:hypothetical protein
MDFIVKNNEINTDIKRVLIQKKINDALQEQINHLQSELDALEVKFKQLQLEVRGA